MLIDIFLFFEFPPFLKNLRNNLSSLNYKHLSHKYKDTVNNSREIQTKKFIMRRKQIGLGRQQG